MFILLFIVAVGALFYSFYYFSNKISIQKNQLVALKKQCSKLKHLVKNNNPYPNKVTIYYKKPTNSTGKIKCCTTLKLSPLDYSPSICKLDKDTLIDILDSAEINNKLWYEISIPNKSNINSKGWISSFYIEELA